MMLGRAPAYIKNMTKNYIIEVSGLTLTSKIKNIIKVIKY